MKGKKEDGNRESGAAEEAPEVIHTDLYEAIMEQIGEAVRGRLPKAEQACAESKHEYLMADPERTAHGFKYALSIKVVWWAGRNPCALKAVMKFNGPKYESHTKKPSSVQMELPFTTTLTAARGSRAG